MFNGTAPAIRLPDYDLKNAISSRRLIGLWRLMAGYQPIYFAATFSTGLAALANTVMFLVLRNFIDSYLGSTAEGTTITRTPIWLFLIGIVALAIGQGFFTFLSRTLAAQTSEGLTLRIRNFLYDHIQRMPFRFHDQTKTGDLLQRATSDVDTVRRFFADQAIEAGRILLLFVVNFFALAYLGWQLALVSIVIMPFIMGISVVFFKRIEKRYSKHQEQQALLSTRLQENLTGVRVVKAFARQEYEIKRYDNLNQGLYQQGKQLLLLHALYWPITDILCGAQMLGGYALAATFALQGDISIGTYTAYVGLVQGVIWPLRNLGRLVVQMSESQVSLGRVAEMLKEEREVLEEERGARGEGRGANSVLEADAPLATRHTPLTGHIRFEGVDFHYAGLEKPALQGIDFEVRPGQRVALLGTTGSGKTSIVNLLPRFYDVTAGCILLDGVDIRSYDRSFLRRQIGIVEQEPFLFSKTIRDNIAYSVERQVTQAEIEEVARAAAVHDVILSKFPKGYDTLVGERGITLSGGQKQRVAIARTLLKDPRILILDDATSSVDTETESEIRGALRNLMKGRTSFIIAHRIQSVMDANLILVLDKGRIVQQGTHETLLAQTGPYRRIFDAQTRIESELENELHGL